MKKILIALLVIFIDFGVYIFLGLVLLNYEDFYDESEGPYWSFESMTFLEKASYIGYYTLIVVNILAALYLVYRVIKHLKANLKIKANKKN